MMNKSKLFRGVAGGSGIGLIFSALYGIFWLAGVMGLVLIVSGGLYLGSLRQPFLEDD
jgi:hypothetical protein